MSSNIHWPKETLEAVVRIICDRADELAINPVELTRRALSAYDLERGLVKAINKAYGEHKKRRKPK